MIVSFGEHANYYAPRDYLTEAFLLRLFFVVASSLLSLLS
jgi:hypothetical protein